MYFFFFFVCFLFKISKMIIMMQFFTSNPDKSGKTGCTRICDQCLCTLCCLNKTSVFRQQCDEYRNRLQLRNFPLNFLFKTCSLVMCEIYMLLHAKKSETRRRGPRVRNPETGWCWLWIFVALSQTVTRLLLHSGCLLNRKLKPPDWDNNEWTPLCVNVSLHSLNSSGSPQATELDLWPLKTF